MAFLHFQRQRVDIAVLEIGMGGRLDATNVVDPLLSVITNVSLEHREYLGNTLEEIAREKGGIIKERGRCLTAASQKRVVETLEALCRERGATTLPAGEGDPNPDSPGWDVFLPRHRAPLWSGLSARLQGDTSTPMPLWHWVQWS